MLECQKITRRFGDFKAVNEVSFSIPQGEIVGLLGRNGAGKTTIMRMITGALEPSSGRVIIDGTDIQDDPRRLHRDIGYLPEHLPVYPEMTVVEYLDYCAGMRALEQGNDRHSAVRRVVEETQLRDKLASPIGTLSRGYKQRVGVAQALLSKPRYLVLDEPTNGLDPEQTRHMRELITSLRREATVIISTHIMQEVNAVCDRVLMIHQGSLALDSPLAELANSHRLLLHCRDAQAATRALRECPWIASLDTGGESAEYGEMLAVNVSPDRNLHESAAELTRCLVQADVDVYGLAPEKRDLESLFLGISEGKEVDHAA